MIRELITRINKNNFLDLFRFPLQFVESLKTNGLVYTLHEIIYLNREIVVVEKDLSTIQVTENLLKKSEIKGIEINKDNFDKLNLKYPLTSRYLKALKNLKRGYKSFAIIRGHEIIGDIWYSNFKNSKQKTIHPDLEWLGLYLGIKDVYLFDLYVNKEERNNLIAISLFKLTLQRLKLKGYSKVYSFIFADNKPSITFTLFLKFRQIKRLTSSRFLFYKKIIAFLDKHRARGPAN